MWVVSALISERDCVVKGDMPQACDSCPRAQMWGLPLSWLLEPHGFSMKTRGDSWTQTLIVLNMKLFQIDHFRSLLKDEILQNSLCCFMWLWIYVWCMCVACECIRMYSQLEQGIRYCLLSLSTLPRPELAISARLTGQRAPGI